VEFVFESAPRGANPAPLEVDRPLSRVSEAGSRVSGLQHHQRHAAGLGFRFSVFGKEHAGFGIARTLTSLHSRSGFPVSGITRSGFRVSGFGYHVVEFVLEGPPRGANAAPLEVNRPLSRVSEVGFWGCNNTNAMQLDSVFRKEHAGLGIA